MVDFKVGQLIFFNFDNIFGNIIKIYNLSKHGEFGWTHVGIISKVRKDAIQIHEAGSKGFVKGWYSKDAVEDWYDTGLVDLIDTKIKTINLEWYADQYLGRPYAWHDIIGICLSYLFGWKFLKITGASKLICSEAIARLLYDVSDRKINFEEEYDKPYDLITPMDLYNSKQL
ncbi:MAG: hypothetical protein KAS32_15595 [Candidatus Peribacteraceae bacterium]|nr:hypothetical protein [Candidatus Peribacteraceae bacterium]